MARVKEAWITLKEAADKFVDVLDIDFVEGEAFDMDETWCKAAEQRLRNAQEIQRLVNEAQM